MKFSDILGLNARSQQFSYNYNTISGKKIAASKLLTKKYLIKANVPIPTLYAKFNNFDSVLKYDWNKLPASFALKPNKGLGGEGIIVVKKKSKDGNAWITTQRKKVTKDDLQLHIMDILEGAYSLGNDPDRAYIEEYVGRHKTFKKFAFRGTPDIRIIVFNRIPVMAMLRLPTKESGGRANLHQGAIGVGVDIASGITTRAIHHGKRIKFKPDTKRKLNGIKIPNWERILEIAVKTQEASLLGYLGVDVVLHPEKGPMVLEINSQPGLSIQMANGEGLRRRLLKIEDMKVRDAEHGVKVAQALFAGPFADKVRAEEGIKTINVFENIVISGKDGKKMTLPAKIDTGAWSSSIDRTLASDLGLLDKENVLWKRKVYSAMGREKREVVNIVFWLKGRKIKSAVGVADRSKLRKPLIIGRRDLTGFIVEPAKKE